jgi:tRNA nucleotidyltransferase (CCA-adding enzyme)
MMPVEQCYGIIIVFKDKEDLFLVLERAQTKNDWTFPKGHREEGETPKETAIRETIEETGIREVEILDLPLIREEYEIIRLGEKRLKVNEYFIGIVSNKNVLIEEKEIQSYKWITYEEGSNIFMYERRKQILKQAKEYLEKFK